MRRLTGALTIAAAVLAIVLLACRVNSVVQAGTWGQTSGFEAVSLNLVARTAIGLQPYGDLERDATPALFNGLFYLTYGTAARALSPMRGPVAPLRLLSLSVLAAATILLAVSIAGAFRRHGAGGWSTVLGGAVAIVVLLGPFVGWWAVTVRPDAVVLALETCALLALRRSAAGHGPRWFLSASLCAIFAWGFKQNAVTTGAVLLSIALIERRPARAAGLALAWAALALLVKRWAGPYYFFHIVSMAASAQYSLANALLQAGLALRVAGPMLLLAVLAAPRALAAGGRGRPTALVFLVALAIGSAQLLRVGASTNYLFLAWTSGALLVIDEAGRIFESRWRWLLPLAAVHACVIGAAYLVAPDRVGRITLVSAAQRSAAVARSRVITEAAAPRFVQDNIDALPWHSGQTIIETVDDSVYWAALRRGLIHESVLDRIARRHYASGFAVTRGMREAFEAAGYERVISDGLGETTYYRR